MNDINTRGAMPAALIAAQLAVLSLTAAMLAVTLAWVLK